MSVTQAFSSVGTGLDFVLIPAGTDPLGRYSISFDFYMMTTEVTDSMWDAFMGSGSDTSLYASIPSIGMMLPYLRIW